LSLSPRTTESVLNWNVALETSGWLVNDDVHVSIDLAIVKQPETVPVAAARRWMSSLSR
jgi:hypothetical protein